MVVAWILGGKLAKSGVSCTAFKPNILPLALPTKMKDLQRLSSPKSFFDDRKSRLKGPMPGTARKGSDYVIDTLIQACSELFVGLDWTRCTRVCLCDIPGRRCTINLSTNQRQSGSNGIIEEDVMYKSHSSSLCLTRFYMCVSDDGSAQYISV
jgi:hypothetical protein